MSGLIPGEIIPAAGEIELNAGRPTITLTRSEERRVGKECQ